MRYRLRPSGSRGSAPALQLGTLQVIYSKKLGLGAQETLNVAQALYETHMATTYPGTDCGYPPTNMLPEVPAVWSATRPT